MKGSVERGHVWPNQAKLIVREKFAKSVRDVNVVHTYVIVEIIWSNFPVGINHPNENKMEK